MCKIQYIYVTIHTTVKADVWWFWVNGASFSDLDRKSIPERRGVLKESSATYWCPAFSDHRALAGIWEVVRGDEKAG